MRVVIKKLFYCGAIIAMGLQLVGCYTDYGPVMAEALPIASVNAASQLQAGDRIKVTVYGEDNLTGLYDINPAGNIELPLVGSTRAAGHMPPELAQAIASKYRNGFLKDPKVTVEIVTLRPYYIFGEVEHPGQYPYTAGLNVFNAAS